MNTQSVKCERLLKIGCISTAVECYLSTRGGAKIDKLLSLSSSCTVEGTESLSGEGVIKGHVNHRAIYLDENATLRTMDYLSDFSTKVLSPLITPTTALITECEVVDSEVSTRSDSEIKVTSAISICVYAILSDSIEVLSVSDDVICDTRSISTTSLATRGSSDFIVSNEISVGENVTSILLLETSLSIRESVVSRDKVTVSGEVYATVSYENDGVVGYKRLTIPYSEEIFADGAMEGDAAFSIGHLKSSRINLSGEKENTSLEVECSISLKSYVMRLCDYEVVTDCFSTTHSIDIDTASIAYGEYILTTYLDERVTSSIDVSTSRVSATSTRNVYISSVTPLNDSVRVEGVVDIDIVYCAVDGYACSTVETPFSVTLDAKGVTSDSIALSTVCVKDINTTLRNGAIEVSTDLRVRVSAFSDSDIEAVRSVEILDETLCLSPLILKRVKVGESMWDVSKCMRASEEDILAQNPDLALPLNAGDVVKYFRHLEV